jgi:hypothetical protein
MAKTTSPIQEATYYAALQLVGQIDHTLHTGLHHYRTTTGHLLTSLDEVVRAILDDSLLTERSAQVPEVQDESG